MDFQRKNIVENFHIIGINHYRSDVAIRELFALTATSQEKLLEDGKSLNTEGIIVLSTCNRTEIYTQTSDIISIQKLLVKHSKGSLALLEKHGYIFSKNDAIEHLYRVGSGLDSQILGDFQIIGQLKNAYKMAEKAGTTSTLLNRVFSHIFQTSKKIKNQTNLSNGTASVAHAAVQHIKENITDLENCKLLLYGIGEIGQITCDNLVRHLHNKKTLTLINRSKQKAINLAEKYKIQYKQEDKLQNELGKADVIIVATGATTPTITKEHFKNSTKKSLILDLSVPRNVCPKVTEIEGVELVDIDKLSQIGSQTLKIREESVPKAEQIIQENYQTLQEWLEIQQLSPLFKQIKAELRQQKEEELAYHRAKLSESEYKIVEKITTNIINRIARSRITELKKELKEQKSSNTPLLFK